MQNNLQIEFRGYTDSKRHSHSNERNRTDRIVSLCLLSKRKKFHIFEQNFASIAAMSAVIAI